MCEEALDVAPPLDTQAWLNHTCDTKGCKEGYVTIDGNEKLRRPKCAAPRRNIRLTAGMPRSIDSCPNTPCGGGRHQEQSKYCPGHADLGDEDTAGQSGDERKCVILTVNIKEMSSRTRLIQESTETVSDVEVDEELMGCKRAAQVKRYSNSTAGILAMVKPCGVICGVCEMFTCESSTQVFGFLLRVLHECDAIRFVGYDRACELEPFLKNLAAKGNPGAELLLSKIELLVDIFHVLRHKSVKCMPLENNPQCRFHPHLPRFASIHGANTEVAEQLFSWLRRLKANVRHMTRHRFRFFLEDVLQSRNEHLRGVRREASTVVDDAGSHVDASAKQASVK